MSEDVGGVGETGSTGREAARSPKSPVPSPQSPLRMPAEWERHDATWIAWPHHEPDWPGKLAPIPWVYGEIVRVLAAHEPVEILCHDEQVHEDAGSVLAAHGVDAA